MTGQPASAGAIRMRRYRGRNARYSDRNNLITSARAKAWRRLAQLHRAEFGRLYAEELEAAGVTDTGLQRACACGGVIIRTSIRARFPATCENCKAGTT
jgi:hypothetical protein